MTEIQTALQSLLPPKRKLTPSGWISFNAVCCHNRSESKDNRQRGGMLLNPAGGFQYHCFNCNFKAGWTPGHLITKNTKNLFKWLGMSDDEINKISLAALQLKEDQPTSVKKLSYVLEERKLPDMTFSLTDWANTDNSAEIEKELLEIVEYITYRGMEFDWYPWHWCYAQGYRDRILIPFYHEGKIVGWTGRKITDGKPKYLTDSQPGYVFNLDHQTYERKYVIVVEGPFDAISVDGIAILHNEPNETQCTRINALSKEVIVVPDRDRAGSKLLNAALEHNWSVSLPPWETHIKDVADAVKNYGRIYTLATILQFKETNKIKIQLLKKKLESYNE